MPLSDDEKSSTRVAPYDDGHAMLTSELELDASALRRSANDFGGGYSDDEEDLTHGVWSDDPFAARAATRDESEGTFLVGSDDERRSDSGSLQCAVSSDEDAETLLENDNQPFRGQRAGGDGRRRTSGSSVKAGRNRQHNEADESDDGDSEDNVSDDATMPQYTGPTLAMLQAAVTYSVDDVERLPEPSEASPGAQAECQAVDAANGSGNLQVGKEYYLVESSWWRIWRTYARAADDEAESSPGPIDNTPLLVLKSTSSTEKQNHRGVRRNSLATQNPLSIANDVDVDDQHNGNDDDIDDEKRVWELRQGLQEVLDFETLSPEAWQMLVKWHGGGPVIKRRAYSEYSGGIDAKCDLYGIPLVVRRSSDDSVRLPLVVLQAATVGQLTGALAQYWDLHPSRCRLWDYFNGTQYALLDKQRQQQLFDANLTVGQEVMLEEQDRDGNWIWSDVSIDSFPTSPTSPNAYSLGNYGSSPLSSNSMTTIPSTNSVMSTVAPEAPGLVGLDNLGNTCFMNSILQSLGACPLLRDPFRLGQYKSELNLSNPLGYGGKVADGFAELMQVLYQSDGNRVAPRAFKHVIGQLQPQFQGYAQHDAQELLNFLLDGLHEDVNRVLHKEMTAPVEANGRPDSEVASESVATFKKRNDSLLTDLCSGLFRSTLVCPDCGFVSKTFDPFFSVSVPLAKAPSEAEKDNDENLALRVLVCPARGVPEPHIFQIPRKACIVALRAAVAARLGNRAKASCLVVVELYNHAVYKVFGDLDSMDDVTPSDELAVYEVEDVTAFHRNDGSGGSGGGGGVDIHYLSLSPWPPLPPPSAWPAPSSSNLSSQPPKMVPAADPTYSADAASSPSSLSSRFLTPGSVASALFDAAVATEVVSSSNSAGPGWVADFGDGVPKDESSIDIRNAHYEGAGNATMESNAHSDKIRDYSTSAHDEDSNLSASSVDTPNMPPLPPPPIYPPTHPRSPWVPGAVYFGTLKPPWSSSGSLQDEDHDDDSEEGYGARLSAFVWSGRSKGDRSNRRSRWNRKPSAIKPRACRLDVLSPTAVHEIVASAAAIDTKSYEHQDSEASPTPAEDLRSDEVGKSNRISCSVWPPLSEGCEARGVLSWQSAPGAGEIQVVEGAYLVDLSFDPVEGTATVAATQPNRWLVGGPKKLSRSHGSSSLSSSNNIYQNVGSLIHAMEPVIMRGPVEADSESSDNTSDRSSTGDGGLVGEDKGNDGYLWWGSIAPPSRARRGVKRNTVYDDDVDENEDGLLILEWQSARVVAASEASAKAMGLSYDLPRSAEGASHDRGLSADVFDAFGSSSSSSSGQQIGDDIHQRSVVVNVVHKRRKPRAWSGLSSERVGVPLLLTVRADATEQQVRELILAKAQLSGAAVQSFSAIQVLYANDNYDEDTKYGRKGKEGQEVGLEHNMSSSNGNGSSSDRMNANVGTSLVDDNDGGLSDNDYIDSSEECAGQSHSSYEQSVRPTKRERPSPQRFWTPKNDGGSTPWFSRSILPGATSFAPEQEESNNRVPVVLYWGETETADIFPLAAAAFSENQPSTSTEASRGNIINNNSRSSGLTLDQCFSLFAATETLPAMDSWRCPKCEDFKEATKTMDLWSTPPLLCVHLKRFSVDAESFWVDKLETPVSFPTERFDLRPFCVNPDNHQCLYTLCAVVNHFGGAGGGHYTAHARCESNGKWYEFDDSHVTEVSASDLDPSAAYVLFYLREDLQPTSWTP